MSFLFVFQNDNDLIDNDNAGQSPAAQAVVLTFTLTYYLILTLFRFSFGCFDLCLNSYHIRPFFIKYILQKFPQSIYQSLLKYFYKNILLLFKQRRESFAAYNLFFCNVTLFTVQFFLFHFSHIIQRYTQQTKNASRVYKVSHVTQFTNYFIYF